MEIICAYCTKIPADGKNYHCAKMEFIQQIRGFFDAAPFAERDIDLHSITCGMGKNMVSWVEGVEAMKDFPVFTTEYGVASLVLKQIPYQGAAYITLQDSLEPEKLLEECVGFCRVCGAEAVYATGHEILEQYPLFTAMWEMRCPWESIPDTDAGLFPVVESTLEQWRNIYNEKVRNVPNGAWMTQADGKKMLETGDGYFVHRDGRLLGIGRAAGDTIDWVASVKPGAGRDVVLALAHAIMDETVKLTVAEENEKAVKLYKSLGFIKSKEISRWYCTD